MSDDLNNIKDISEKSESDIVNDAIDALNAENTRIDLNQLSDQEMFVQVLHSVMSQSAPSTAYKARSKAFLMQKFGEEHAKRNAMVSFVNMKQNVIDFSKVLARSAVLVPIAASVIFAFVGGYMFGNISMNNDDIQTAKTITANNVQTMDSSPEIQTRNADITGITGITGISLEMNRQVDDVVSPQSKTEFITTADPVNTESTQSSMFVSLDPKMAAELAALQASLSKIAELSNNDQPVDSALLHQLTGSVHTVTGYISNNNDLSPTFVMNFLNSATGVVASLAATGNPDGSAVYVSADLAAQEGIITVAKFFDANPEALAIYAASNW